MQLTFSNIVTTMPHVKAGKLVALAVNEPKRVPAFPDLPAVAETVPGFEMAPWVGIIVPAKTPKPIVERLSKEVRAVMADPAVVKILAEQQVAINALDTDELTALIKKDMEKWADVIKRAGIKVQ